LNVKRESQALRAARNSTRQICRRGSSLEQPRTGEGQAVGIQVVGRCLCLPPAVSWSFETCQFPIDHVTTIIGTGLFGSEPSSLKGPVREPGFPSDDDGIVARLEGVGTTAPVAVG
jgi:hypothetical protein